jgi:glycosyltransferase involved in cell wall biosynthesis
MTADASPLRVLAWPAFDNTTGNPYNRLLYEAMERQGPQVDEFTPRRALLGVYDIWHMHWPDDLLSIRDKRAALLRVVGLILLMAWMRLRGTRIVWTVHDLGPHESYHPVLERWFWRFFLPQIDGFISLSQHGKRMAERVFPALQDVPGFVVPHGHYRDAYADTLAKDDARQALDLAPDAPVLLYVGRIRRYKNVPHLVRIFRMLEDDAARLFVVGNPASRTLQRDIRTAAGDDPRIRLTLEFVPDEAMQGFLKATDLVVLPYEDILHSGSALLALSFNRPVLVPNRGAMTELQTQVGPDWVRTYEGPLSPDDLEEGLQWAAATDRAATAPLDALEWTVLATKTHEAYEAVRDA